MAAAKKEKAPETLTVPAKANERNPKDVENYARLKKDQAAGLRDAEGTLTDEGRKVYASE